MFKKIINNQLSEIEKYAIILIAIISFTFLKYNLSASLVENENMFNLSIIMLGIGIAFFVVFSFYIFAMKEFAMKVIPINVLYYMFLIVFSVRNIILSIICYFTYHFYFYWTLYIIVGLVLTVLCFIIVYLILGKFVHKQFKFSDNFVVLSLVYLLAFVCLCMFKI